jgi:hypothetical protein
MRKIFDHKLSYYTNVTVGKNFTNESSYIIGYWEAGDILVDMALALEHPQRTRLFFPICFNYRHFIELCIKQLIFESEKIYQILKKHNMHTKDKKQNYYEKINKTHNIKTLLNWLIITLDCFTEEIFSNDIKNTIFEIHNMDETGQKFRYPKTIKNISHFEKREDFDLNKIKEAIYNVGNYLFGVDMYLSEFENFIKTYIAEMGEAYYQEHGEQRYYMF